MYFLRDSFCLSAVSLSRQRHYILDFAFCSGSHVLHVTLTNLQTFRFEFHLRSLPRAFDRQSVHVTSLLFYFLLLHCADETQPGRKSCTTVAILGLQFGLYHVVVPLTFLRGNQPCFIVVFLFLAD